MGKLSRWAVALLLPAAVGSIATADAAPVVSPDTAAQSSPRQNAVPSAKGRLKFKSAGPVCMCGDGLSEREIEAALAKINSERVASGDSGGSGSGRTQSTQKEHETNLNLGVAK